MIYLNVESGTFLKIFRKFKNFGEAIASLVPTALKVTNQGVIQFAVNL
jgi:hypothetical protein